MSKYQHILQRFVYEKWDVFSTAVNGQNRPPQYNSNPRPRGPKLVVSAQQVLSRPLLLSSPVLVLSSSVMCCLPRCTVLLFYLY